MPKVLLVEDNEMNRDMLARRLRRKGFAVATATDGLSGVEAAAREKPDLILMDVSLGKGKMDGLEATRRIKADPATAEIPVLALTAHSTTADRQQCLDAGCSDFDTKPVDLRRLLAKIAGFLG